MRLAADSGLAPALTIVELNALATVLSSLQSQILAGGTTLVIAADEHLKHSSSNAKSRRFAFEKLVQILAGLRLLAQDGDRFTAHPLFGRDEWRVRPDGELQIELEPAELGPELVLGLSDAHWDLVRRAQGKLAAGDALQKEAPLTLWRSVWLELQAQEQWLFLRMERGIQWEFRWLQLDGVFGSPLGELFDGIPLPAAAGTLLSQRLKLLAKLGKKLCSQGFLTKDVHEQFLALGGNAPEAGVTAIWQVSRDRLAESTSEAYRSAACQALLARRQSSLLPDLVAIVLADSDAREKEDACRLHRQLADAKLPLAAPLGLDAAPNQLVSPLQLFWELSVRSSRTARFKVPAGLLDGRAASFFQEGTPALERLAAFAEYLVEDPDFVRAVRDVPFASLASATTQADPSFAQAIRGALDRRSGAVLDPGRPRLVTPDAPEAPSPATKKKAALNGALAARMLKVAYEELQKLKAQHPDRYRSLKKSYVESLDELGRKLMLDVQRRMQPSMFDEHLRQRLVRFMVDNPGAWRSPSAQLAEI